MNIIEESLTLQTDKSGNRIYFSNYIITNMIHIKGEQRLRYNMKICRKKDSFDVTKNMSEYVTLVQLMDSL